MTANNDRNLNTASFSLFELESELDTEEYENMRDTFRDTWRTKHGTKFISFSERTLGENLASSDQYERYLNYMFLGFFVCWLVNIVIDNLALGVASCAFLWVGDSIIVLNLRFTLMKFQFESLEFCYLIFSAIFTFCLASSMTDWDVNFTWIRFTYYLTFIAIISFDCLEDKLRKTSKWVLFIGGMAFLINSLRIQFTPQDVLVEEEGFVIRTYYLGKESDAWTNLATYCRMNIIQSFFCFKMFYHLHYHVDYSYFITERRRNENFNQFSLKHEEGFTANTFRSYAAFMEKMERHRSKSGRTSRSVRVVAPDEVLAEMSDKFPSADSELVRTKSDPTKIAVQIRSAKSPLQSPGKSPSDKSSSLSVLKKEGEILSEIWNDRKSLTITVTNQQNISETIIGGMMETPKFQKDPRTVTFDVEEALSPHEGLGTRGDTTRSADSDMYAPWIPREGLIKFFNFCAISLLFLHLMNIFMPLFIFDVFTDFCIIAMGSIVFLNLKFEYFYLIMYDVEYIYLMISCVAAFYFHCDVFGWAPVRIFRNAYTWMSFAAFAHFDLLVNEMKQTLKYILGFMVISIWLLYASYLLQDEKSLEEWYTIKTYNISENDQYTNLELFTRIAMVMSLFWLKLAYHLWYYFEYFYFNRLLIKLDSFLNTSSVKMGPMSPTMDLSQISVSQTPQTPNRGSIVSVTPDTKLAE